MMLEGHGFPSSTADGGLEAIETLGSEPVDVILMDTQMPGLSGLELIAALRSHSAARIIAISGSKVSDSIRTACDGFLLKPVEPEDLVAVLAEPANMQHPVIQDTGMRAAGDDHGPVIQPEVLSRLTAMMPAASVREIYDAVAADLKKRLDMLEVAMCASDSAEVSRIAHSVKGGSAMVGFTVATEVAGRLEDSNLSEAWPMELGRLHKALAALEGILGGKFPS